MSSGSWRCGMVLPGARSRRIRRACWRTACRCWSWRGSRSDPDPVITPSCRSRLVAPTVRCERPSAPLGGGDAACPIPAERRPRWSRSGSDPVMSSKDTLPDALLSYCTYTLCIVRCPIRCRIIPPLRRRRPEAVQPLANLAQPDALLAPRDHAPQPLELGVVEQQVAALGPRRRQHDPLAEIEVEVRAGESRGGAEVTAHVESRDGRVGPALVVARRGRCRDRLGLCGHAASPRSRYAATTWASSTLQL